MTAFVPLEHTGLTTSLLGTGDPVKYLPEARSEEPRNIYRRIHGSERKITPNSYTIILIVISALIFITVVAVFDVVRNAINNYYAKKALKDPRSNNTKRDIERAVIANKNNFYSSVTFAFITLFISIILIPLLFKLFKNKSVDK